MSANAWTAYLSETTMPALWRMWALVHPSTAGRLLQVRRA